MVGERLRQARLRQQLSLQEVATQAKISAATLSRIETSKQAIDVGTMLELSNILGCRPSMLVEDPEGYDERDRLIERLASLDHNERVEIWRALAEEQRAREKARKSDIRQLAAHLEELLAQIDLLRAEIEVVRLRLK